MRRGFSIIALLWLCLTTSAQSGKISMNGYVSNKHTYRIQSLDEPWITESLFHNRLNFQYYASDNITFDLEFRNRFINSDLFSLYEAFGYESGYYADQFELDKGFLDLSWNWGESDPLLLNTMVDRIYLEYNKNDWNVILGRQRINWGQCFAWNPNDIFNSFTFFDFDYVERPGSDAIRVQYYTGMASHAELAIKLDNDTSITAAGLYQFNQFGYDIQLLGGLVNGDDYVGGFGFSGNIKNVSLRGELSYYIPVDVGEKTMVSALGIDYTFENSLSIQLEGLYNQHIQADSTLNIVAYEASSKRLGFSEYTLMANVSYPISPLLTGTMAFMYIPDANGYYIGPSFDISLADNINMSVVGQYFYLEAGGNETKLALAFIRFKYSF